VPLAAQNLDREGPRPDYPELEAEDVHQASERAPRGQVRARWRIRGGPFTMRARGWHNGSPNRRTGAGYGLIIAQRDRDAHFQKDWRAVCVRVGAREIVVTLGRSFWNTCADFHSAEIGRWMVSQGLAPWERGHPPVFELRPAADRTFVLCRV